MPPRSHPWFEQRSYCHFDSPLSVERAEQLVASREYIATHAFSPLISVNKVVRVWKRRVEEAEGSSPSPQPVSGPRPARAAQAFKLRKREAAGEATNRGTFEIKLRQLVYASHVDAAIYSFYHFELRDKYEKALRRLNIGDAPLAYRFIPRDLSEKGKSSFHFAADSFASINRLGTCRVHCLDIKSFFDKIPHSLLMQQCRRVLGEDRIANDYYHVLQSILHSSRVPLRALRAHLGISTRAYERMCEQRSRFELGASGLSGLARAGLLEANWTQGVPQGLPLSGLLANIAMLEIDCQLTSLANATGCTYRRYSDDILVFGPNIHADSLAKEARRLIELQGFTVPPHKATDHTFDGPSGGPLAVSKKPLVYLGLEFDGRHVRLKSSTISRLEKRARRCVKAMARGALRAARRNAHRGPIRLNRRRIYNLFSPLPFKGSVRESDRWRGDFTDYARNAQEAVRVAFGCDNVSQITKQIHPRMGRLLAYIHSMEKRMSFVLNDGPH